MNRVEIEKKVLNENQLLAEQLRQRYREHGLCCVNLISAPGSGKTLLLERTLRASRARLPGLPCSPEICKPRTMPKTCPLRLPGEADYYRWNLSSGRPDDRQAPGGLGPQ